MSVTRRSERFPGAEATRASSWTRKVKHLTRGQFVQVDSSPALKDGLAMEACRCCGWRGLYARTFRRPLIWNVYTNTIRRRAVRVFAVCGREACQHWREL